MADDVSANLQRFVDRTLPDKLGAAMALACADIQSAARAKAPVDTGNLRRSIDFEVSQDGSEGSVFSMAEYAPYVEVGTGIHSAKGNGRKTPWRYEGSHGWTTTSGAKAQPFLEPAAKECMGKVSKRFEGLI